MVIDQFRKILKSKVRSSRRRRRPRARAPIAGVPEGLTFETLNEMSLQRFREPLTHVAHLHLSSWKAAGSFRLLLQSRGDRRWSLVYKNAIYSMDHIPALAKLPITPGPPEYLVYSNVRGDLAKFVPVVYLCAEIVPGKHYQYLLEDLNQEYRKTYKPDTILKVAAQLPAIHRALGEWSQTVDQNRLLQYGREFSVALQHYASNILESYAKTTANTAVSELCNRWSQISDVHLRKEFHQFKDRRPIHGDLNPSNILMHNEYPARIKLVDWEWSGLGAAHADYVSLLSRATPEIRELALASFAEHDNHLSLDEHRRLYQWCVLERALLNAAFCAAQLAGLPNVKTKFDLAGAVERAARRALYFYKELE